MDWNKCLLGEKKFLSNFEQVINENANYIINIFGEDGVGKTRVLKNFAEENEEYRYIWIEDYAELVNYDLSEQKNIVVFIDDIDEKISEENLSTLINKTLIQYDSFKLILTSKNRFFTENIAGINIYSFELGCRNFTSHDFGAYIRENYSSLVVDNIIVENIFLFATYIKNFNHVNEIIKVIEASEGNMTQLRFLDIIEKSDLYNKLKMDLVIEHNTNTKNKFIFNIRRKDPIEKLRDIFIQYYEDESLIVSVLKSVYGNSRFIDELFNMNINYEDKVMQLCFTYNPIELIIKLLGVRDIIHELKTRNVKTMSLSISIEDKAKLLLKDIGLNILDKPKGIRYFRKVIVDNYELVKTSNELKVSREHLIGLGISCYQELENIFQEVLNFYAKYFCGSTGYLIEVYNTSNSNYLSLDRLTYGNYIQLFRFINRLSNQEEYQIALFELGRKEAINNKVMAYMEKLSSKRQYFSHKNSMSESYVFMRNNLINVFEASIELVDKLIEKRIFPEIIKIKEIIFDEYGRKLFVGYDDADNEIRFSISHNIQMIDIYMHYYVIRKNNSFAINPIIIPKNVDDNETLFNDAEGYDQSSHTQLAQANKLIEMLSLENVNKLLDIGCGNGMTTIELYSQNQEITIDAFDVSPSMIEVAKKNLKNKFGKDNSINFFTLNAIDLSIEDEYDMIFSNAALHWVTDSQMMYSKIFRALKPGGEIAIHQGGYDSYRGLHEKVREAIELLGYNIYYTGWKYPIFYPRKKEMERLLRSIGYESIHVRSYETNGKEYTNLIENFANAGMLPYLSVLEDERQKKQLQMKYFEVCKNSKVDQYSHRLYIFAKRGDKHAL